MPVRAPAPVVRQNSIRMSFNAKLAVIGRGSFLPVGGCHATPFPHRGSEVGPTICQ
jgi:hypothetical protein